MMRPILIPLSSPFSFSVPSRPRALTKGQSQHMVEPLQGPMEESQQVDRSSHRLAEASPKWGVDQERCRPRVASPKRGIAQERGVAKLRRREEASSLDSPEQVARRRERWLQGHKF